MKIFCANNSHCFFWVAIAAVLQHHVVDAAEPFSTQMDLFEATDATSRPPPPQVCGGVEGLTCPIGKQCIDDPSDSCDPNAGGSDCSGFCKSLTCPSGPGVTYASLTRTPDEEDLCDPDACPEGSRFFSRRSCGCGCRERGQCPREDRGATYTEDIRSVCAAATSEGIEACRPTCVKRDIECPRGQRKFRRRGCGCGCIPKFFWVNLVGKSCLRATRKITRRFRGLNVICVAEGSSFGSSGTVKKRVKLMVNEEGTVVSIPVVG